MKERNRYIDVVRGIAVILMVFGHCIQYGNGAEFSKPENFFYNKLFQIIYSFHMPLFMLLSGYLFAFTARKIQKTGEFIKNRFSRILLPIMGWQAIMKGIALIREGEINRGFLVDYICSWVREFWFLWAILYSSVVVFLVRKYLKDCIWVYLLGFVLTFWIPDIIYNLEYYKFMYPYFIIGYLFAEHLEAWKTKWTSVTVKYFFLLSVLLWGILFAFWNYDAFIYTSRYTLLGKANPQYQFGIDIYRMVTGLAGGSMVTSGMWLLYHSKLRSNPMFEVISRLGRESLGIYIISGYLVGWFLIGYAEYYSFSYSGNVIETIVIIGVSYLCTILLKKIRVTNCVLLGGR